MQGISRAIDRALDNAISPWKLCRPAGNFKVWSIERRRDSYATETVPRCKVGSCSIHDWRLSDDYCLELASVPIITGQDAFRTGLSVGSPDVLKRLFEDMEIPISVLSSFLNNRIQFTIFPSQKAGKAVHLLNFRQWAIAWNCDAAKGSSKAILLWMGGSWAKLGIERHVKPFLGDIAETRINHHSPGLLGVLLCARNVAESLADLDEEAFHTERRLRQLIQDGQLKQEDELGRLSAAHGWLFARSIRERSRLSAASSFLEYATSHRPSLDPNRAPASRAADLEALQLLTKSLLAQAAKLGEESNMHLSTIYNLIAQRDQATNLAIAAASREIALQSKVDQENSLEIAQASKKIAEESRKDSNAMKMIAIVTMVYLPGTFVATCFSMGIFQWTARASDVVSPRIWVYFLFTAVLTILTIGGFVGWTWWQDRYFPQDNVEALSLRHSAKFDSPGSRPAAPKETIRTNTRTASMVQSALIEPPKKSPLINVASVDAEKSDGVQSVSQPAGTTQPPPLLGPLTLGGVPRSVSPFQNMNRRSELPRRHLRQRSVSIRSISPPDTTLVKYNGPPFTTSALARHALRSQTRSRSRSRSRSRTRSFDRDFRLQMRHGQSRSSSSDSLPDKRYTARARSRERAQPHGDRAYPYRSRSRSVDRGYRYENRNRSRSRSRTRLGSIIFFPDESTAEHKTHDSNAACPESVITTIRQSHNVVELDTSSQPEPEPEPEPEPGLSSDSYLDIRRKRRRDPAWKEAFLECGLPVTDVHADQCTSTAVPLETDTDADADIDAASTQPHLPTHKPKDSDSAHHEPTSSESLEDQNAPLAVEGYHQPKAEVENVKILDFEDDPSITQCLNWYTRRNDQPCRRCESPGVKCEHCPAELACARCHLHGHMCSLTDRASNAAVHPSDREQIEGNGVRTDGITDYEKGSPGPTDLIL